MNEEEVGDVTALSHALSQICKRWGSVGTSRTFVAEGQVRWCWLSLLLHLAVKTDSIKEQ